MDKKGGEYQYFRSKIFCLTVPITSVGDGGGGRKPLAIQYFRVSEKFGQEGGGYPDFPSKITCLTVPKLSGGESFAIALISGIKKVGIRKGVV